MKKTVPSQSGQNHTLQKPIALRREYMKRSPLPGNRQLFDKVRILQIFSPAKTSEQLVTWARWWQTLAPESDHTEFQRIYQQRIGQFLIDLPNLRSSLES